MADHGFPVLIIGNPAGGFLRKRNMPGNIRAELLGIRVHQSKKPRRPFEPVWARLWDAWDPGGGIRSSVRRLNAVRGSRVPRQLIGTRAGSSGIKVTGLCEERIILPMAKDRDLIERHARLFSGAKKRPNQDPRKARYAELVARTAHKYQEIAMSRGVPVKPKKTT